MRIFLRKLEVVTHDSVEVVAFHQVTFIHGPLGTGKSTVARLIDFCFGGDLVETPAIQSEFVAARLFVAVGDYAVVLERDRSDAGVVRATWQAEEPPGSEGLGATIFSAVVPFAADKGTPIIEGLEQVENLSDLIFHLSGIAPIRVRRSKRDPDAPLVRLSFRDLLFYCYLDQDGLDSSFFSFEHPFKRQKGLDALRFVVGFHSERLNELEQRLARYLDEQRAKRAAAEQLQRLLQELEFQNEAQIGDQLQRLSEERGRLQADLVQLEGARAQTSHPLDALRGSLRELNSRMAAEERSFAHVREKLVAREALRAELLTGKVKALRSDAAQRVLRQVEFKRCPQCETPVRRSYVAGHCSLCGQVPIASPAYEELASEFDRRNDELEDLIARQKIEVAAQEERLGRLRAEKRALDSRLNDEARRYDSAFVARLRELERALATTAEREKHLHHLRRVPASLERLVREAGELQGSIDATRKAIEEETNRLSQAQTIVQQVADRFKALLLDVGFPGMTNSDTVDIDTRFWQPEVSAGALSWGFDDLGSGGKKVLFKVLYALALHEVASDRALPLPTFLIIDSPTKNISHDVNPELFEAFYREVYRVAQRYGAAHQFLLIDAELVSPSEDAVEDFSARLFDHTEEFPPLISYYRGH